MSAILTLSGKEHSVEPGVTIEEAVRAAGSLPDAFLFLIDGRPVPMDTPIEDGMTIKAVKVSSGG